MRSGDRMNGHGARRHTRLRLGERDTVELTLAGSRLDVRRDGLAPRRRRQRARQLVLGREHDVGRAHEGVGPRREDGDARVRVTVDPEDDLGALRAADPAALRGERPLGPVDERQVLGEPIGIGGDPQHPLAERRAVDGMAAALALAVDDLLVGQHGAEGGAPVDRRGGLVGEPATEELEEDPLGPADIPGIGGVDLPGPVIAEAEHPELALEDRDVARGRRRRMLPGLDRVLLGGEAERVPAHRVEHVVAAHAPGARQDVGGGVPLGMTDVQADAGRVGEHVEDVALGPAAPARGAERPVRVPVVLPARLDLEVVVGHVSSAQSRNVVSSFGSGGILIAMAWTGPLATIVPPWAVPLNSLRSLPSHVAPLPSMMYWISSVLGCMCLATLPDWMPIAALPVVTRPLAFISGLGVVGGRMEHLFGWGRSAPGRYPAPPGATSRPPGTRAACRCRARRAG